MPEAPLLPAVLIPQVFPPFNLLLAGIPAGVSGMATGGSGTAAGGEGNSAGLFGPTPSAGMQLAGADGWGISPELSGPSGQSSNLAGQGSAGSNGAVLSATGVFSTILFYGPGGTGGTGTTNRQVSVTRTPLLFASSSGSGSSSHISIFTPVFPPFNPGSSSSSSSDSSGNSPSHPGPSPNSDMVPPTTLVASPPEDGPGPNPPPPVPPILTPEPATFFLIIPGLACFVAFRSRRPKR
jgi:hypothetical protein